MHNAYVMNNSSDREHLLSFSSMDDARDLFSLTMIAIFLNVLDERTYCYDFVITLVVIRQSFALTSYLWFKILGIFG